MKLSVFSLLAYFTIFSSWAQTPQILVPFRSGAKWGYSDTMGRIKIKPRYDTVSLFDYDLVYKEGHVIAEGRLNGKPIILNEKGAVVVPPNYEDIKLIYGSEAPTFAISKNNKFGLFANGKELFAPISDWLANPYPGLYEVRVNGKSGLINNKGQAVLPFIYDHIRMEQSRTAGFMDWQCINYGKEAEKRTIKLPQENWLSQRVPDVETLADFITADDWDKAVGLAKKQYGIDSVQLINNIGIIYKSGTTGVFLPKESEKIFLFSKPYTITSVKYFSFSSRNSWNKNSMVYIIAGVNSKYGIINEREEQILPFNYDSIEEKDGLFLLKQNGKIGFFIWNTVYPVIQPAYDEYLWSQYILVNRGWRFTLFKVIKNGRVGFVGENGVNYFKE
jgi:hypothetical protein